MTTIKFENLNSSSFTLENISAIELVPKRPAFSYSNGGRGFSGFLYITEGSCRFSFRDMEINAGEGSLIYLPQGSEHSYKKTSETIKYIRIDFIALTTFKADTVIFSELPVVIFKKTPSPCADIIKKLSKSYISNPKSFYLMGKSYLFRLLAEICNLQSYEGNPDITPAIKYIEENYTKSFPKTILSDMCKMSPSHFRCIFRKSVGCSPGEYQQHIRLEKAVELLRADNLNVSEIAEQLGFESVYYFSRFFKSHTGCSPLNWKKRV